MYQNINTFRIFVKLHSNLQAQLNFSWLEKELTLFSHGRRKEGRRKEGRRRNPHLASNRRNDPTCLNLGDCLVAVWKGFGNCLEGVWQVSGRCLVAVWRVSEGCVKVPERYFKGVWRVSLRCLNDKLVSQDW